MSCPACFSCKQAEFSSEMVVHLGGIKNLDNSGVWLFPKLLVCFSCGFSQFTVPETELALLAAGDPNSDHLAAGAGC